MGEARPPSKVRGARFATGRARRPPAFSPPGSPAASTIPAALPRGFTLHRDRRGFSLAVPDGWTTEESEASTHIDTFVETFRLD